MFDDLKSLKMICYTNRFIRDAKFSEQINGKQNYCQAQIKYFMKGKSARKVLKLILEFKSVLISQFGSQTA